MFWKDYVTADVRNAETEMERLKMEIEKADAIVIGAGAGLSTAAGFTYSGKRFKENFGDFIEKYGFCDMYSGGFYPYSTLNEYWAYWSRYIWVNRYMDTPKPVYEQLFSLVKDKDYFVITTNVDHCFQKAGFDKKRLFYTQGDYGLLQCSDACHDQTYDNKDLIRMMLQEQKNMQVPVGFIPRCPKCGKPMVPNLRADDKFVEDEGWHQASQRYSEFLRRHENMHVLFLELGVGHNTPVIVKYPFWQMTEKNSNAVYACLNYGESYCPESIGKQSILIDGDIAEIMISLKMDRNHILDRACACKCSYMQKNTE